MPKVWVVRMGKNGECEELGLKKNLVIAGWPVIGDLKGLNLEGIRHKVEAAYPSETSRLISNWVGQLDRFVNQISQNDIIIVPLKGDPGNLSVGEVISDYYFDSKAPDGLRHRRNVKWDPKRLARTLFDPDLQSSMCSLLTVFELSRNDAARRILEVRGGRKDPGMPNGDTQITTLDELQEQAPVVLTRRQLLGLVKARRRSANTLVDLHDKLEARGLLTESQLSDGVIDDSIRIVRVADKSKDMGKKSVLAEMTDNSIGFPVSAIPSAISSPIVVQHDDPLSLAQTIMLENNFSQLPVMDSGAVVGTVTWESIATTRLRRHTNEVKGAVTSPVCMDAVVPPSAIVSPQKNLLEVVPSVLRDGYVLVAAGGDVPDAIGGIITVHDLATIFGDDRRPMMLVEEIELNLRRFGKHVYSDQDIKDSECRANDWSRMTLGAYPNLLKTSGYWERLGWDGVDKSRFLELVEETATIRNSMMHFSQDPISPEEMQTLNGLLRILRALNRATEPRIDASATETE